MPDQAGPHGGIRDIEVRESRIWQEVRRILDADRVPDGSLTHETQSPLAIMKGQRKLPAKAMCLTPCRQVCGRLLAFKKSVADCDALWHGV